MESYLQSSIFFFVECTALSEKREEKTNMT